MKIFVRDSERLRERFGSRRVFVVFYVCWLITVASMLVSAALSLVAGHHTIEKMVEHLALGLLGLALLNIPVFLRTRFKFDIPAFLQISVTILVVAHCVLGEIYRFYDYVFLFDKALHVTAGGVIAIFGFSIVYGCSKDESGAIRLPPVFISMFSFCFALALLSLWEVFEYLVDTFLGFNMQRWRDSLTETEVDGIMYLITNPARGSGLNDTMTDLIVGIIGAAVICAIGGLWVKKHPNNTKFYVTKMLPQAVCVERDVGQPDGALCAGTETADDVQKERAGII